MALPWERLDFRWLHVVGVIATVEAAVAVAVFGQSYTAFYFLIAVAVAYVTPDSKALFAHLLVIGIALFGPIAWGPAGVEETLQVSLVVFPLLCLSTGIFSYLRQRMVADRSSYRVFAEETLSLATRIAGRPLSAGPLSTGDEFDLPLWSHQPSVSARDSGAAACVLALPLITAGLAVAGVRVPSFAADTLNSVGIELPNQQGTGDMAEAATDYAPEISRGYADQGNGDSSAVSESGNSRADGHRHGMPEETGTQTEAGTVTGGAKVPSTPSAQPPPSGSASTDSLGGGGGSSGGVGSENALGDTLDDTLGGIRGIRGIRGLLGGLKDDEEPEGANREAAPPPESGSAQGGSDGLAGPGDEVDEGSGDDAEEDAGEGCDEGESDDDAAADSLCGVELG